MTGQPRREKDEGVEQDRANVEFHAKERSAESGIAATYTSFPITQSAGHIFGGGLFVAKDGDVMRGGLENSIFTLTLISDVAGISGQLLNTNRLVLLGQSGAADNCLTLIKPKFESDMILYISNKTGSGDITLLNDNTNVSNFRLDNNTDLVLTAGKVHELFYDSVNELYREITTRASSSASEVFTWTGNHTAAGNNLLLVTNITFNNATASISSSASGLNHNTETGTTHSFSVNSSSIMDVSSSGVTIVGNVAIVSGGISSSTSLVTSGNITLSGTLGTVSTLTFSSNNTILGGAGGLDYNAITGTDHTFSINSSAVLSIAAGAVTVVGNIAIVSGGISSSDSIASTGDISTTGGDISISAGSLILGSSTPLTGSIIGWTGLTGDIYGNVQSGDSYFFRINGSTVIEMDADGIDIRSGYLELRETTAPGGSSNDARVFSEDNGSGKTRLMVQFGTGSAIQLAIEA